jgi:hygromycin-B 7''-O-kinase
VTGLEPPRLDSNAEYARRLRDHRFWVPLARAALDQVGLAQPARVWPAPNLGTYPVVFGDTGVVVKLFGDRYFGPESYASERNAYRLLRDANLPIPRLLGEGELFPATDGWPWPFIVLSQVPGQPYAECEQLDHRVRERIAEDIGHFLRALHAVPLDSVGQLAPNWEAFTALLERRRREAAQDHRGWAVLPAHLVNQIEDWLPAPGELVERNRRPRLVHGDLHTQHLFVGPEAGRLVAVIDFTDAIAGDARYDFVALHLETFRGDKQLLRACLQAYGPTPGAFVSRDMLALALLHEFNMFEDLGADAHLERFATLDELASALWDLDALGLDSTCS